MLVDFPSGYICNTNGVQWKQQVQALKVTYGPEQVSLRVLSKQKQLSEEKAVNWTEKKNNCKSTFLFRPLCK